MGITDDILRDDHRQIVAMLRNIAAAVEADPSLVPPDQWKGRMFAYRHAAVLIEEGNYVGAVHTPDVYVVDVDRLHKVVTVSRPGDESWRCPARKPPEPSAHVFPQGEDACACCGVVRRVAR